MSNIGNIQGAGNIGRVQAVAGQAYAKASKLEPKAKEGDTVEISQVAELLGKLKEMPDIRTEKVAEVRQAIRSGTYDVDSKLDATIERLLEDL